MPMMPLNSLRISPLVWHFASAAWNVANVATDLNCQNCGSTVDSLLVSVPPQQTQCDWRSVYAPIQDTGPTSIVQCSACTADNVPSGYVCVDNNVVICPIGHYCPDPLTVLECEQGYWCKEGFQQQKKCRAMINCPAGADMQSAGAGAVVALVVFGILVCGCSCGFKRRNSRLDDAEKEKAEAAEKEDEDKDRKIDQLDVPKVSIQFEDLTMYLKVKKDVCVLDRITGTFPECSLVALMGPSGGGKTTFMNALCGRASYGNITGNTKLNGRDGKITSFPKSIGFVPQDDIMYADMTVKQNIYYNAKLRLPVGTPEETIEKHTCNVVEVLGLKHHVNSIVGSPEKRGISGGQKKRVNIGMELAAQPAVIFMDEPTSGLDGAATIQLAKVLGTLREAGLLIVCVVHQPRFRVFTEFTQLLLLGAGGGQIYSGTTANMEKYFNEIGFRCPDKENPADWMIDIACGLEPRYLLVGGKVTTDLDDKPFDAPADLFKLWEKGTLNDSDGPRRGYKGIRSKWDGPEPENREALTDDRNTPSALKQFLIMISRELRRWNVSSFMTSIGLLFFSGSALGLILRTQGEFAYSAIEPQLTAPVGLFNMICTINARAIYASERLEFTRDFSVGQSVTAYWCAKTLWSGIALIMYPLAYTVPCYWFMPIPAQTFGDFYRAYLFTSWYHQGLGMVLSLMFREATTSLLMCTFAPIMLDLAFSGTISPIKDQQGLTLLLSALSCGRWLKIGIFGIEMSYYPENTLEFEPVREMFEDYKSDIDKSQRAYIAILITGFAMRVYVWSLLYFIQHSEKGTGPIGALIYVIKEKFHAIGINMEDGKEFKKGDVSADGVRGVDRAGAEERRLEASQRAASSRSQEMTGTQVGKPRVEVQM